MPRDILLDQPEQLVARLVDGPRAVAGLARWGEIRGSALECVGEAVMMVRKL